MCMVYTLRQPFITLLQELMQILLDLYNMVLIYLKALGPQWVFVHRLTMQLNFEAQQLTMCDTTSH